MLWLLCLIPVGLLIVWWTMRWKKSIVQNNADYDVFSRLYPDWSVQKTWLRSILLLLGFALLFISWANPQWGNRKQKVTAKSSDVILALDISQSMLADDISPNRMERSKQFLKELIKKLRGDRIGLIYFAGGAYLQMPLTNDYGSAMDLISSANPTQAGTQGTVIADAIDLAQSVFASDNPTQKAIILISDGENHETEAITAASKARENGTFVYTLGIGTEDGAMVPFIEKGKTYYKKNQNGQPVKSRLNVNLLKEIAEAGGGKFYMIDQTLSALRSLDNDIERMEKQEVEQRSFADYNSFFQYFLFLAILLFVIEHLMDNRKNKTGLFARLLKN